MTFASSEAALCFGGAVPCIAVSFLCLFCVFGCERQALLIKQSFQL